MYFSKNKLRLVRGTKKKRTMTIPNGQMWSASKMMIIKKLGMIINITVLIFIVVVMASFVYD